MSCRVVIALGGNLGAPDALLRAGWADVVAALRLDNPVLSPIFRTPPAEQASGPDFANAVGVGYTRCDAAETLEALLAIERRHGRDRAREGYHGARPLDLDLIDWGGIVHRDARLTLPHPRAHRRAFVLVPLASVVPDWRFPGHDTTVAELLAARPASERAAVRPWA